MRDTPPASLFGGAGAATGATLFQVRWLAVVAAEAVLKVDPAGEMFRTANAS